MKEEENQSVLFDQQVCDAFASAYETTDTTRGERERLFWEWLNAELAKAWREGALSGFIAAASCSQALIDAEQNGWTTRYDGTAFCPDHRFQKGHQK